jgi:glutaredoxin
MKKMLKSLFSREKFTRITLPIILVIVLAVIGYFSFDKPMKNLNEDQAKTRAEEFINSFLMTDGTKATITEISEQYGLYKLKVDIVSDVVESYLSRDGKLFFPQALDIDEVTGQTATGETGDTTDSNTAAPAAEVSQKSDKPVVEVFVMSYCPYGTQIEKGLLPVLETLGNKIDFELKFCSYIMHGDQEITENLLQYCIQKEQPTKLNAYLECFLADSSKSEACLTTAGIDKSKVTSCVAKTDKEFKVTENNKNKVGYQGSFPGFDVNKADNEKYNVGGSPTLVINGQEIASGRDSASLLKTICSAFNNPPKECETELSSASPAPGFGTGTTAGNTAGGCE